MRPCRLWHVTVLLLCLAGYAWSDQEPKHLLKGTVVNEAGEPVEGVQVGVAREGEDTGGWGHISYLGLDQFEVSSNPDYWMGMMPVRNTYKSGQGTTDQNGQFLIEQLKAGPYILLAAHPTEGLTTTKFQYDPAATDHPTITLEPAGYIYGQLEGEHNFGYIRVSSNQCAEIKPDAENPFCRYPTLNRIHIYKRIGKNGKYCIGPLPTPGEYSVSADSFIVDRGFFATLFNSSVSLKKGETFCCSKKDDACITGRVLGPDGKPLQLVNVTLRHPALDEAEAKQPKRNYSYFGPGQKRPTISGAVTNEKGEYRIPVYSKGAATLHAQRWSKRTGFG